MAVTGRKQGGADGEEAPGTGLPEEADPALAVPKVRYARRRAARPTTGLREAVEPGAAGGVVLAELDRLRHSMDQLAQGLGAMVETQATHTELLDRLLQAATEPTRPEQALARILEQLVVQLDRQGSHLQHIGAGLARLPDDVGTAVAREVSGAIARVR